MKLSDGQWRRLIVWMVCNAPFYGACHDTEKQANGELVLPHLGLPADWQERVRAETEKK